MAKRYSVGIDVDGVLAAFTHAARQTMKKLFAGRPDDLLVQTTWAFESLGITAEEERIFWRHVDNEPNWWLTLKALPFTFTLPELVANHRCVFITNRKDGAGLPIEQQTSSWLRAHFGLREPTVVISNNKGPVAVGLKLDYFIDDRPKNVSEVINCSSTRVFLCDATYNASYDDAQRVANFDQFAKIIIRRANG